MQIEVITDSERLQTLRLPWARLWRRDLNATPFQSPAWLLPWWRHFGSTDLRTLALWEGDELRALAPMYIYTEPGDGRRKLFPIGIGNTDYLDVLVDGDLSVTARATFFRDLRAFIERLEIDEWDWQQLSSSSHLAEAIGAELTQQDACPVVDLMRPDLEAATAFVACREEWPRAARKGLLKIYDGRTRDARWMVDALIRFHSARWETRGEAGVLADAVTRAFVHDAVAALADEDLLRASVLSFDGRDIAALLSFETDRARYCYLSGFDPEFSRLGPGKFLMWKDILAARAAGRREYDLLRGQEKYKYRWGARDRWNSRLVITPPTASNSAHL